MKNCSIVIMTHNRCGVLERTINGMLNLKYSGLYEVIVVNDGSEDRTADLLKEYESKIKVINEQRMGPCAARNNGIRASKYPFVVIMDDDCIPDRDWLTKLMVGFVDDKIAVVSAFSMLGGTSTAFRKDVLIKVGMYDEEYFYYREDTDLIFRILDNGFKVNFVGDAEYEHVHEPPKTFIKKIKYILERIDYHKNDVLLFKKQGERSIKFFDIIWGFMVNPIRDISVATRLWTLKEDKSNFSAAKSMMSLSSPQGIVLIQNKSIIHEVLILLGGVFYSLAVKSVRLYGSFKYRKFLI